MVTTCMYFSEAVELASLTGASSETLPPVSRLEDSDAQGRCKAHRAVVAHNLASLTASYQAAHEELKTIIDDDDLQQYYHIYEVSLAEYSDALRCVNEIVTMPQQSLKDLRFLFRVHIIARKIFMCHLLAVASGSAWKDLGKWKSVLLHTSSLGAECSAAARAVTLVSDDSSQNDFEYTAGTNDLSVDASEEGASPQAQHIKAQMRRLDAVTNGIRALNAKVRIIKEDLGEVNSKTDEAITTSITKHYENLGADLRSLVVEWEKGRNTMFLHVCPDNRLSVASSGLRSPMSPTPSLGGLTMVDGGPAEAFKLLEGDEDSRRLSDGLDEEVFEAVSKPRKRMTMSFSREEKLAKLQEDRKRRATQQEQADTTTNMLRELQMVIKHRPHVRTGSRVTSL